MKRSASDEKRSTAMGGSFRARIKNGVLEPLEKIDLPEGTEVIVVVHRTPSNFDVEASRRTAGSWKDKVDADELIRNIYAARLIATRPEPRL